jgi:hypothetical protein
MSALALVSALSLSVLAAAPDAAPNKLTLELRAAQATAVYALLADVSGEDIVVDECLAGRTLDIVLKNAPTPLVFDVVAAKLGVHYEGHDPMMVRCGPSPNAAAALRAESDARWQRRLSLEIREGSAQALLLVVAQALGLRGGVVMQAPDAVVSLRLDNVRASVVADAIVDCAGFGSVVIEGDHLVVTAP